MPQAEEQKLAFKQELKEKAQQVNDRLGRLLEDKQGIEQRLAEAMKYSLQAPGKRIRGAIVLWCCELLSPDGGGMTDAETAAASVEMVHTYSLIHDDLPAMDDDDMRRGQPSCHVAFDQGTAILAGDALLTMAFEVIAEHVKDPARAIQLVRILAEASGACGMVSGQMADLEAEKSEHTPEKLEYIHINKTARMFQASAEMGAIAGGGNEKQYDALSRFGMALGLGFQIADDILDVSATSEQLGKTAGKDISAGKLTYPAMLGIDQSRMAAERLSRQAMDALECFGSEAEILRILTAALLERSR